MGDGGGMRDRSDKRDEMGGSVGMVDCGKKTGGLFGS